MKEIKNTTKELKPYIGKKITIYIKNRSEPKTGILEEIVRKQIHICGDWFSMSNLTKVLGIFTLLFLVSCGTRKTTKSITKSESETKTEIEVVNKTVTETKEETNTKIIDTSNSSEITIEPVDNSKPINVNGKTYSNAKITVKKHKSGIVATENKKVSQIERNDFKTDVKAKSKTTVKERGKNTERTNTGKWWQWLIAFGLVALLFWWGWWSKRKVEEKSSIN